MWKMLLLAKMQPNTCIYIADWLIHRVLLATIISPLSYCGMKLVLLWRVHRKMIWSYAIPKAGVPLSVVMQTAAGPWDDLSDTECLFCGEEDSSGLMWTRLKTISSLPFSSPPLHLPQTSSTPPLLHTMEPLSHMRYHHPIVHMKRLVKDVGHVCPGMTEWLLICFTSL